MKQTYSRLQFFLKMHPDETNWNVGLFIASDDSQKYTMSHNEQLHITIDVIYAARVLGSFSSKQALTTGLSAQQELTVNDGKLDLPVHKQLRY